MSKDKEGNKEAEDVTHWDELRVTIPSEYKGVEITYSPASAPHSPQYPRHRSLTRFISLRSVFILIFLAIIIAMGVGLIALSHTGQMDIASNLSGSVRNQIDLIISHRLGDEFSFAENTVDQSRNFFYELSIPPNGTNMFYWSPALSEYFWSISQYGDSGIEAEFDFPDSRLFGVDNFPQGVDAYMFDFDTNATDSNMTLSLWDANTSLPILLTNFSKANIEVSYPVAPPYPFYPFLRNSSRDYLLTCDSPKYWLDMYSEVDGWSFVSVYSTMCNKFGDLLGYMSISIGIPGIEELLSELAQQYRGKLFIMNGKQELISSSTYTPIYIYQNSSNGITATRQTVYNTQERWIKDVFAELHGNINNHTRVVTINSTEYVLQLTTWDLIPNINWYIVKIFEYDQFFGETMVFVKKSIIISIVIAAIALGVVLFVTYVITRPLQSLARNMQRMATLDLDLDIDQHEPLLVEVKKLHHSFLGMNVALKSFKKFVPAQIISRILASKKEVVAELKSDNITIMFQDIEGFTSLSETMEPKKLAQLTSEYMSVMTDIICKHGGTIDKYVGDCIMSLFNTPDRVVNHPTAATQAAVECYLALLEKNKEWKKIYGVEMLFRTGINTGEVLIGNMGSDNRMNYTAFGDNVNIAARLEGVNKLFGTRIIVSKDVHKTFPKGKFISRKLGKIRVSGKSVATTVYEVRADGDSTTQLLFMNYESSLKSFKNVNFVEARSFASKALEIDPTDHASLHLAGRIDEAMKIPDLPPSWSYTEGLLKY